MDGLLRQVDARHGRLSYFANDTGAVSKALALYGEWAENEISFICGLIPPGGAVLDIGAYVGTHTLAFARHVGAQGQVIAIEAQPATFALLSRNVADNQLAHVRLENMAMGNSEGELALVPIDVALAGSFGSASINDALHGALPAPASACTQVRLGTIDALDLQACDLIKIDAEGAESLIIEGAAGTIRRLGPAIYAECNSVADGLRSLEQLHRLGYVARLHLVDAFAADNFLGEAENVFGAAREAALVAVPASDLARLDGIVPRPCEKLIKLQTADDLVLGMLNKPQYAAEVLRPSGAAASGAADWLDETDAARQRLAALSEDVLRLRASLESEGAQHNATVHGFAGEIAATRNILREDMVRVTDSVHGVAGTVSHMREDVSRLGGALADALEQVHGQGAATEAQAARISAELGSMREILVAEAAHRALMASELGRLGASLAEARSRSEAEARAAAEERRTVQSRLEATNVALEGVARALALQRREMEDQRACFEAAMRQARAARDVADACMKDAAEAQRLLHDAAAAQAATEAYAERQADQVVQLGRDIAMIRASTSWRLTAPIRRLVGLWKRQ